MPRLLVSVRSVHEALSAAEAGAHFIDLKDPASGALGANTRRRCASSCTDPLTRKPSASI